MGIGYGLLVLFFAIGVFSSAASFKELQRPEFALRNFIRFVLAKVAVGRGMEIMTAIFSICGSVVSATMNSIGGAVTTSASLPGEIISAIEDVGFMQSIPLWLVSFLPATQVTSRGNADRDALVQCMGERFTRAEFIHKAEEMGIKPETAST